MLQKTSIRLFGQTAVRAVWCEGESRWCYSAIDCVSAMTDSSNPRV